MWQLALIGIAGLPLAMHYDEQKQARPAIVDTCAGAIGNDGRPYRTNMMGLGGDDMILSHELRDRLDGGTDNDLLRGGGGDDDQVGGPGTDIFVYDEADRSTGRDRIEDFQLGTDMLAFAAELQITRVRRAQGSTMLSLSNGGCIIMVGVARLPDDEGEYVTGTIPERVLAALAEHRRPRHAQTPAVQSVQPTPAEQQQGNNGDAAGLPGQPRRR